MSEEKKQAICRRFVKAATTYDQYAVVQQKSATDLARLLPTSRSINSILEIGCGTGNYTEKLADHFPHALITAVDFADAMIFEARKRCKKRDNVSFLCDDGEKYLQNSKRKFDCITSNATMQWFMDLPGAFFGIAQHLEGRGIFLASLFGPLTLRELAAALGEVFTESIVIPAGQFADRETIRELLQQHFTDVRLDEIFYEQKYPSLRDLLHHIKNTGIGGFHPGLPMLTRGRRRQLTEWFHAHGGLKITYQVFLVSANLSNNQHIKDNK